MKEFKISVLHTNRTDVFNKYITEVNNIPLITSEEEVELAKLIREGDKSARDKLVNANLRFVVSVAKRYEGVNGLKLVDLISEGNYGLIKAANKFDETRGFKFISYAIWWIRQSILQAVSNNAFIKIPSNQLGVNRKVATSRATLEQELEREPSAEEIASILETPISAQEVTMQLNLFKPIKSLDIPVTEEGGTLLDILIDPNASNPDKEFELTKIGEVYSGFHILSEKEKDVIDLCYGLTIDAMTYKEVAEKLQTSVSTITSIRRIALRKLRIYCKEQGYQGFTINPYKR